VPLSISEVITQNTVGQSEGYPVGVPQGYSWYGGTIRNSDPPPSDFTAVTGWGQIYQEVGGGGYYNPQAHIYVANAKTYVHLKATDDWVQVQDQAQTGIGGGHFVLDYSGNSATSMTVTTQSDGSAAFDAPTTTYNDHFWFGSRGTYAAGSVDAVYTQMDMRVDDPNLHLVASIGADWWRSVSAPFVDGYGNNPGAGISNWVDLSTQWKTLGFYSMTTDQFKADPAPILSSSGTELPDTSLPTPEPAPTPVVTEIGTGSDSLVLYISQDAYNGDAQYTVKVDGVQIGGTFTAHALHAGGTSDTLKVNGDWAVGNHIVAVEFVNDYAEGSAGTDRNLYIDSATYNGAAVPGSTLPIWSGTQTFTVSDTIPVGSPQPAPAPITGTNGNDMLTGTTSADTLTGRAGNDTLNGGDGEDVLFGGTGRDVFQFSSPSSANGDMVMDFVHSKDKLDFAKIDATTASAGDQAFVFDGYASGGSSGHLWVVEDSAASVTHVYGKTGDFQFVVDLQGTHLGLTASDFFL
jgi:Ca2+-binding RTX toxin-like protein